MTMTVPEELEYDLRGQICPSTLLTALREVNRHKEGLRSGGVQLVFVTDNRTATSTIPDAVRNMGYGVKVSHDDGTYRIGVGRSGEGG